MNKRNKEFKLNKNELKGLSNYWFVIILLLTIGSYIYLFNVRTLDEILKYSLYIAAPLEIFAIVVMFYFTINEGLKKKYFLIFFGTPIIVAISSSSYYAVAVSIKDIYEWIPSPSFSKNTTIFLTITTTLLLGIILFLIRLKLKTVYGISELLLGLFIACNNITNKILMENIDSLFLITYLTASIYLVVRGLDNIHQGLTKDPKDPLAHKLFEFLKKN